jgi:DNA-binding XRE family transcriptional regulator
MGISQKDAAKALGILAQTLSLYELNRREVPIKMAIRIAKFYGVSVEEIFDDEEEEVK